MNKLSSQLKPRGFVFVFAALTVASVSAYSCTKKTPHSYAISTNDGVTIDSTIITEGEEYKGTIKVIDSNKYIGRLISATLDDTNDTNITEYCTYTIDTSTNTASLTIPKEYTVANISVEVRLKDNKDDYEVAITSNLFDDDGKKIDARIYLCRCADMTFTETPIYFNKETKSFCFWICTDEPKKIKQEDTVVNFLLENVQLIGSTESEKLDIKIESIDFISYKAFATVDISFNDVVPTGDLTADVVYNRKTVTLALNDAAKEKWDLIDNDSTTPDQRGDSLVYNMKNFSFTRPYSILVKNSDDTECPTEVKIEHSDIPYIEWTPNPLDDSNYTFILHGDYPTKDCTITLKCIDD